MFSERPAEAADRAVPGHWEKDLIIGTGRSAIGTVVERKSRSTLLVHLPRLEGWGENPYVKNGPALGGYGAVAMNAALVATMTKLPEQLRKTLTWDRGKELSAHAGFALETGTKVFFADPHSALAAADERENTNWVAASVLPEEGFGPLAVVGEDLEAVALALNSRHGKSLNGALPQKSSRSSYARFNGTVLQRPIEPKQYTSAEYANAAELDIRLSVGRTGSCLDNAVAESWFSMLKNEMYHRRSFATSTKARFTSCGTSGVLQPTPAPSPSATAPRGRPRRAHVRPQPRRSQRDCLRNLTQPTLW